MAAETTASCNGAEFLRGQCDHDAADEEEHQAGGDRLDAELAHWPSQQGRGLELQAADVLVEPSESKQEQDEQRASDDSLGKHVQ